MEQSRYRAEFPASEGWIVIENNGTCPLGIVLKPWHRGTLVPVGQAVQVLTRADGDGPVWVSIWADQIQVHCADALYWDGEEVVDMTDYIPAP